jgi:hypothetical protein
VWHPIPENTTQPRIDPSQVILHSIAGPSALNAVKYAEQTHVVTEFHFAIEYDGTIIQALDTNVRADANLAANHSAVSIETASNLKATDVWTPAQVEAIVRLCKWLRQVHPAIAARRCRSPEDSGFGYHTMWGAPSSWTPVAKTCPGPKRIIQFPHVLGRILTAPTPPLPPAAVDPPDHEEDISMLLLQHPTTNDVYLFDGTKLLTLDPLDMERFAVDAKASGIPGGRMRLPYIRASARFWQALVARGGAPL